MGAPGGLTHFFFTGTMNNARWPTKCCRAAMLHRALASSSDPPVRTTGIRDIFQCQGIEEVALQMRRRVQVGMAIEFFGTPLAKLYYYGGLEAVSAFSTSSDLFMVLHIGVVWWYQSFTRDHLLARHVTRIALIEHKEQNGASATAPASLRMIVDTGPWSRTLELRAGKNGTRVPFKHLVRLGGLHVDRVQGRVFDDVILKHITDDELYVAHEELHVNEAEKHRLSIGDYAVTPLLQDDESGAYEWLDQIPLLHGPLQWHGSLAMRFFGLAALVMGIGSVIRWVPIQWPAKSG